MPVQKGIIARRVFFGCFIATVAVSLTGTAVIAVISRVTPPASVGGDWAMGIVIGTLFTLAILVGCLFVIGISAGIVAVVRGVLPLLWPVLYIVSLGILMVLLFFSEG